MRKTIGTNLEKFLDRVSPEPNTGCWLWTGYLTPQGYGKTSNTNPADSGKRPTAHRVAWRMFRGPIPAGLTIDHLCRVPCCVNPDHLEPVTVRVNTLRGAGPSAVNARTTHCKHGHALVSDNLYFAAGGNRICKTCTKIRDLARKQRLRESTALRDKINARRRAIYKPRLTLP